MTTPSWGFLIGRELAAAGDYDTIPLMPERMFDTRLVRQPDGRWAEQRPERCALGFPLRTVLIGWSPCGCESKGHRHYYCRADNHGHTEEDRFLYVPPLSERCRPVHPQAPGSVR